jgi:hypothetical protein
LVVVAQINSTITRWLIRGRVPILADEGEEPVLDFVPLAGVRGQVADHGVETRASA